MPPMLSAPGLRVWKKLFFWRKQTQTPYHPTLQLQRVSLQYLVENLNLNLTVSERHQLLATIESWMRAHADVVREDGDAWSAECLDKVRSKIFRRVPLTSDSWQRLLHQLPAETSGQQPAQPATQQPAQAQAQQPVQRSAQRSLPPRPVPRRKKWWQMLGLPWLRSTRTSN